MENITSRPYRPDPKKCCEGCAFGEGEHAAWCAVEWLQRHQDADVIVTDLKGRPVRAEYRTLSGGSYPVAYLHPEDDGVNL